MRFMLLIHWDEKGAATSGRDDAAEMQEHGRFVQALKESGKMLDGMRLASESSGRRLQVRAGQRLVTDGPFTDGREAIGGFYLLDCESMDEALEWAARCPSARHGTIEVRPEWTS